MSVLEHIGDALAMAGAMTWAILWALILGLGLSAIVQAAIRREAIYSSSNWVSSWPCYWAGSSPHRCSSAA